ncbi:alpha/beta fold hydrolase [Alteromonas sp. ASW11-36]|uniref:Alpha/beta fold hydrolase n=1 Tax=Alteromonas arenosi TaxID=3055817 RepID=A0ABT7T0X7_9ALTE|nr:alpha/beta fold hydrolase [Alteromonas sp. ASW11-36]MDM7862103.1 alpha/beta fold hydrolase [Alteromonas sp. ASW11-36]
MPVITNKQSFVTADGYTIQGRVFSASQPRGVIVVASATGVPQGFYRKFAEHAVIQGYHVITFDYRGIGESAPRTLRGFNMDYRDWARQDLSAVVEFAAAIDLPTFIVGHSYGGHALGLLSNHERISAAYFFGTGAGWHGWMPAMEKWRVKLMWNVIAPVITRWKGFLGWSVLGMGEDLPLGVYRQWKRWCRFPYYFFNDPKHPEMEALFAAVKTPIKAVTAADDKWAMPASRDAFVRYYRNSPLERVTVSAESIGVREIGHMGYFRSNASALWPDIFEYFNAQTRAC